ncbi:TonB-dependent receptor domain-containing protein [Terrihabitans sp. B22-R8]|uniref:TonB-dependent receptor domain-containing protein n=1 Tax=Terrihabitans sp. B22-R8 TaxID=3425128 RepID=UPI00403C17B6
MASVRVSTNVFRHSHFLNALMVGTALCFVGFPGALPVRTAKAQAAQTNFNIPSQSLGGALRAFSAQAGVQIAYQTSVAAGTTAPTIYGTLTSQQALTSLLAGTDLTYSFTNAHTVTIINRASTAPTPIDGDAIQLETIVVSDGGGAALPYETPGAVGYISGEQIEQYRGTSPADILKGVPGLMSGASRSSGGIDPNIQGLQGMGRVAVTVDGANNAMTMYYGYQGVNNRSYIDPDFIGGISVEKGPSTGAGGAGAIGGALAISTITADDIIPEGANQAFRIKGEIGTNTSDTLPVGTRSMIRDVRNSDYLWTTTNTGTPAAPVRNIDRPAFLEPTGGAGSVVYASRSENFDLVLGAAHRKYGDYHAGTHGDNAPRRSDVCSGATGTTLTYCNRGSIPYEPGLTTYLAGEQVLNTSQDIFSTLAKATIRKDDHTLDLIQTHYDTINGETYAFGSVVTGQVLTQNPLARTVLDTYATRYRWNPDSDLYDLKWNAAYTHMNVQAPDGVGGASLTDAVTGMISADLSNTSRFTTGWGEFAFNYGAALLDESTGPGEKSDGSVRDGDRTEVSGFINATFKPIDWLQLDGGLRHHHFWVKDNYDSSIIQAINSSEGAWDYSVGASVTALDWLQPFVNYRNAARMPSLWESVTGGLITIDPDLGPERASSWQIGANLVTDSLLREDDTLKLKLSYFDNTVDDYIYRRLTTTYPYPQLPNYAVTQIDVTNLDKAKFSGLELSGRYAIGTFSAELAATYYTEFEFCRTSDTCVKSSLGGDYSTNNVPPEFSVSLTLNKKFFDDRFLLSGRATYHGRRAADAEDAVSGANPLIAMIPWDPVLILDANAQYKITEDAKLTLSVENLTDEYYVDPLSFVLLPAPGRTIKAGFTTTLSDAPGGSLFFGGLDGRTRDWSGFHVGGSLGATAANTHIHDYHRTSTNLNTGAVNELGPAFFDEGDASHWLGEIRAGYDYQFDSNFVLGFNIEAGWTDIETGTGPRVSAPGVNTPKTSTTYETIASVNVRGGFAAGDFLVYGKGGIAAANMRSHVDMREHTADTEGYGVGFAVGGGLEYALTDNISVFGEYQHMRLWGPDADGGFVSGTTSYNYEYTSRSSVDHVKTGANFRF